MFKPLITLLASVFVMAMANPYALAMEFKLHPNNKSKTLTAILATGKIEEGDTQSLRQMLQKLPPKKNAAIYLASGGGNLFEGMRLGTFFRESRIKTVIEGGEECASACALVWTRMESGGWRHTCGYCCPSRSYLSAIFVDGI